MISVSRPCYDKYFRCPGWAGGGTRFAKVKRCDNGHLDSSIIDKPFWRWRMNHCLECGLTVLPYHIRRLDWRWWRWEVLTWKQSLKDWWNDLRALRQ